MSSAVELAKLKVAELKDLLKEKDLSTVGVKQELIDRLLAAEVGAAAASQVVPPAESAAATTASAEPAAEAPAPAVQAPSTTKPVDAKPALPAAKAAEPPAADPADAKGETEEERRKKRATRFGVPLVEPKAAPSEKVLARQERFGKVEAEGKPTDNKRKERAAPAAPAAPDNKRKERATPAAPAAPAAELSDEMKAKLEARAKRFAAAGGAS